MHTKGQLHTRMHLNELTIILLLDCIGEYFPVNSNQAYTTAMLSVVDSFN